MLDELELLAALRQARVGRAVDFRGVKGGGHGGVAVGVAQHLDPQAQKLIVVDGAQVLRMGLGRHFDADIHAQVLRSAAAARLRAGELDEVLGIADDHADVLLGHALQVCEQHLDLAQHPHQVGPGRQS